MRPLCSFGKQQNIFCRERHANPHNYDVLMDDPSPGGSSTNEAAGFKVSGNWPGCRKETAAFVPPMRKHPSVFEREV